MKIRIENLTITSGLGRLRPDLCVVQRLERVLHHQPVQPDLLGPLGRPEVQI
jgi:hypothetical protein